MAEKDPEEMNQFLVSRFAMLRYMYEPAEDDDRGGKLLQDEFDKDNLLHSIKIKWRDKWRRGRDSSYRPQAFIYST